MLVEAVQTNSLLALFTAGLLAHLLIAGPTPGQQLAMVFTVECSKPTTAEPAASVKSGGALQRPAAWTCNNQQHCRL